MANMRRPAAACAVALLLAPLLFPGAHGQQQQQQASPPRQQGGACPGDPRLVDPDTPAAACQRLLCTSQQLPADPRACAPEPMTLVFSDEFAAEGRRFAARDRDPRWTAADLYYSRDDLEAQAYKPAAATTAGGALLLSLSKTPAAAFKQDAHGEVPVAANYTSGMLQSWNKVCFTGGYVEFSIKLPDDPGGLWPAAWLMGNLARPGHYQTTEGTWPFSDSARCYNGSAWSKQAAQLCERGRGRGAPEIDVLESGVWKNEATGAMELQMHHTLQMAPVAPPGTTWSIYQGPGRVNDGISIPGKDTVFETEASKAVGELGRPGSTLTDALAASSKARKTSQSSLGFRAFGLLWEPAKFVRFYIDGAAVFQVDQAALKAQSNAAGQTVMEREVPREALSMVLNLAMIREDRQGWAPVTEELKKSLEGGRPAVMSVDYVRVWQRPGAVSTSCSPPDFPTAEYIACNKQKYLTRAELASRVWDAAMDCPLGQQQEFVFFVALLSFLGLVAAACAAMLAFASRFQPSQGAKPASVDTDRTATYLPLGPVSTAQLRAAHPGL